MTIRIKAGDTLSLTAVDDEGDLTGYTIESAVKSANFYYPLTITPIDLTQGQYTISATSTETFPIGRLDCDIKLVLDGVIRRTDTFAIFVDEGITK